MILLLAGCLLTDDDRASRLEEVYSEETPDNDGDGFGSHDDCDNSRADVYPGAEEVCDGRDNDCDGTVDEGFDPGGWWYPDTDFDGFGDESAGEYLCEEPSDLVATGGDCDDTDGSTHPDAPEYCDGQDDDCDGEIDEEQVLSADQQVNYGSLQHAIDGGATRIELCGESVVGSVVIEHDLHISGVGDAATTVLGGTDAPIIAVVGAEVELHNLVLTGAMNGTAVGGGLLVSDEANVSLSDVQILDNVAAVGGGVAVMDSSLGAADVTVVGNSAVSGGGIWASGSSLSFINVTVSGNNLHGVSLTDSDLVGVGTALITESTGPGLYLSSSRNSTLRRG